jgi:hypothetical protein
MDPITPPLLGTLALWMYFWDEGDWVPPAPSAAPTGSLMLLKAGKVILWALFAKEILGWI